MGALVAGLYVASRVEEEVDEQLVRCICSTAAQQYQHVLACALGVVKSLPFKRCFLCL